MTVTSAAATLSARLSSYCYSTVSYTWKLSYFCQASYSALACAWLFRCSPSSGGGSAHAFLYAHRLSLECSNYLQPCLHTFILKHSRLLEDPSEECTRPGYVALQGAECWAHALRVFGRARDIVLNPRFYIRAGFRLFIRYCRQPIWQPDCYRSKDNG